MSGDTLLAEVGGRWVYTVGWCFANPNQNNTQATERSRTCVQSEHIERNLILCRAG